MFDNLEIFRAIAAGIQSYAITCAVIIGGIWTAWVFWLQRRTAVGIDIHLKQLQMPKSENFHILVTIKLENHGTRATRLAWDDEPIALAKLSVPAQRHSSMQFVSTSAIRFMALNGKMKIEIDTGLRPKDTKVYEVVMSVDSPGLYQATFMAKAFDDHITRRKKARGSIEWKAMGHLVVK